MLNLILLTLLCWKSHAFRAEWFPSSSSSPSVTTSSPAAAPQSIQPRRSGHVAFNFQDKVYVFGGYAEVDTDSKTTKRYVTNDLWVWEKAGWREIEQSGSIPEARLVSAIGVIEGDGKAYLFGGWNPGDKGDGGVILDTVHELDIEKMQWTEIQSAKIPDGPSSRLTCCALPNQGSILLHNHRCIDYVILFDTLHKKFRKQPTTGCCPSSRGLHAMVGLENGNVVVFGGASQDGTMSNEIFLLNTETWNWEKLEPDGLGPSPRAAPCLCSVTNHHVLMFGGAEATPTGLNPCGDLWLLDLDTPSWSLVQKDGGPPPRNAATLSEIESNDTQKTFLLTGGWAPFRQTWDDCYKLVVNL